MRPSTLAHLLLLAVVLVWGATFVLVKDALQDISPLLFNLLRMALAFLALVFFNRSELRKLSRRSVTTGLLVGALLAAGYQFQTAGIARTTAAKAGFITGLIIVFVALLTLIPGIRPRDSPAPGPATFVGTLLAFLGLLLLTTPAGTAFIHIFSSIGIGDLLVLLCALAFAGHLLALAHASLHLSSSLLATLQIGAATLFMAVTLPLDGRPHIHLTGRLIFALAITSLLATAAAFTIQSYAQQHLSPTHTALILTLEPVFAWLTSILILHEHFGQRALAGALLILAGIAIIEFLPSHAPAVVIPI